jgi:osmotically-inducible protein OsmY
LTFAAFIALVGLGCGVAKDTQLQLKIKEALKADRNVQADKLTVNVAKGVVTISGELYTPEEIDRVVQIVQGIEGVVEVKNQMSLPDNWNAVNPTFLDPFD